MQLLRLAYRSVCLFGRIQIVEDQEVKQQFCEALIADPASPGPNDPKLFPQINRITVYAIAVERMTGKERALPPLSEQWPAKDSTKTPNALRADGLKSSDGTGPAIPEPAFACATARRATMQRRRGEGAKSSALAARVSTAGPFGLQLAASGR